MLQSYIEIRKKDVIGTACLHDNVGHQIDRGQAKQLFCCQAIWLWRDVNKQHHLAKGQHNKHFCRVSVDMKYFVLDNTSNSDMDQQV